MTETITQEEAEDILYDKNTIVQIVNKHRWYEKQLVVFKNEDGLLRGFYYDEPLTEEQEDQDRFTDLDKNGNVILYPVYEDEIRTIVYRIDKKVK